jgi:hypothetical protein
MGERERREGRGRELEGGGERGREGRGGRETLVAPVLRTLKSKLATCANSRALSLNISENFQKNKKTKKTKINKKNKR